MKGIATHQVLLILTFGVPCNFLLQTRHDVLGDRPLACSFLLVWCGAELCVMFGAAAGVGDFQFLKEVLVLSPLLSLASLKTPHLIESDRCSSLSCNLQLLCWSLVVIV